jgi:hypothetical protein
MPLHRHGSFLEEGSRRSTSAIESEHLPKVESSHCPRAAGPRRVRRTSRQISACGPGSFGVPKGTRGRAVSSQMPCPLPSRGEGRVLAWDERCTHRSTDPPPTSAIIHQPCHDATRIDSFRRRRVGLPGKSRAYATDRHRRSIQGSGELARGDRPRHYTTP